MVWSKELAKLKQGLKAKDTLNVGIAAPVPTKQAAAPVVPRTLEEEDALFLTAVGKSVSHSTVPRHMEARDPEDEFYQAMSQLKGIKPSSLCSPIQRDGQRVAALVGQPAISLSAQQSPKIGSAKTTAEINSTHRTNCAVPMLGIEGTALAEGNKEDGRAMDDWAKPEEIQLAAGMVIEVDGQLDLRNQNETDARERLTERVLDGQCLGWRSLHVILGSSDSLRQVLYDYLNSPQSVPLAKYAQAPVPMGGNKAWILYYHLHSTSC